MTATLAQLLPEEAEPLALAALVFDAYRARVVQAGIHAAWCSRQSLDQPAPWPALLSLYDVLLDLEDNLVVRLNRAVVLAEVSGVDTALAAIGALEPERLREFQPYHAVRADLLRRTGRTKEALEAYEIAISLVSTSAERQWLTQQRDTLSASG